MLFHLSHLAKTSLIALTIAVAIVAAPPLLSVAEASDGDRNDEVQATLDEAPHPFNGAFTELALRGGPALPSSDDLDTGWSAGLALRTSFPMYLADHQLGYDVAVFDADGDRVQVHGLHSALAIHPFYLALLSEGLTSHLLSSLHAEVGLGLRYGRHSNDDSADDGLGIATSVGGGFDLPVTEPNRGRSLWVSANYRRTWTSLSLDIGDADDAPRLHDHRFIFGIALRTNSVLW